ncbi:MAG: GGDEF domain-containing protein [Bradymonadaceae bacterium]
MSWIVATYIVSGAAVIALAVGSYWTRRTSTSDTHPSETKTIHQFQDVAPPTGNDESFVKLDDADSTLPPPSDPEEQPDDPWTVEEVLEEHTSYRGNQSVRRRTSQSPGTETDADQAYFVVVDGEDVGRTIEVDDEIIIGRDRQAADIQIRHPAISRRHARLEATGRDIEIVDLDSTNGTLVNGRDIDRAALDHRDKVILGKSVALKLTFQDALDRQFQQLLDEASKRDDLTGAFAKTYFSAKAESEMEVAHQHGTNVCLVLFDVDHFDRITDTHGPLAGDDVLRQVSDLVRDVTGDNCLFARYGDETFVVFIRSAGSERGQLVGERIRQAVQDHGFVHDGGDLEVTISVGVADFTTTDATEPTALVDAADEALD